VIRESVESAERTQQAIRDSAVQFTQETLGALEERVDETFQGVLGSLAEEASSELVQQELEAMSQSVRDKVETVMERVSEFTSSLRQIEDEFEHVEVGRDTPKEELNTILARYPATNEVKG
jgi:flagellar biosynthesis/type III secretory pathway protein FliH